MDHFVSCQNYGEALDVDWKEINECNTEKQIRICEFVQKRQKIKQKLNKQQDDGQASTSSSAAPGTLSSVELQRNKFTNSSFLGLHACNKMDACSMDAWAMDALHLPLVFRAPRV